MGFLSRRSADTSEPIRVAYADTPTIHFHHALVAPGLDDAVDGFTREAHQFAQVPPG
jgi:hypothetical protein